jgi:hypothetical protein
MPALTGLSLAKIEKSDLLVFLSAAGDRGSPVFASNCFHTFLSYLRLIIGKV